MIETKEITMGLLPVIAFGCGMLLGGLLTSKGSKININLKILNNLQNENIEQEKRITKTLSKKKRIQKYLMITHG